MTKIFKRVFIIAGLIFTCLVNIFPYSFPNCYLPLKMTASFSFVMTALFAFLSNDKKTSQFKKLGTGFIIAAFISFLADFAIDKNFLIGMLLFFVSVLVYFFSCFFYKLPGKKFFIITFAIYIPYIIIINLLPGFKFDDFTIPVAVYSFTILIFTVKAFDFFRKGDNNSLMIPLGTLLFILSDFVLLVKVFYAIPDSLLPFFSILNLVLYFPAQLLIANGLSKDCFN